MTAPDPATTAEAMVRAFCDTAREVCGDAKPVSLWHKLLMEEIRELTDAVFSDDRVALADAVADVVYVTIGLGLQFGVPFDAVFAEVHRSNMTKLLPPIALREDGKIIKGPRFEPPRLADLLDGAS